MTATWGAHADAVLATLFKQGQPAPTRQQLIDAYPFGPRAHFPYKAWCARVKAWKHAHAAGQAAPLAPPRSGRRNVCGRNTAGQLEIGL